MTAKAYLRALEDGSLLHNEAGDYKIAVSSSDSTAEADTETATPIA